MTGYANQPPDFDVSSTVSENWISAAISFATKVSRVIDSVSTGSGSDRITTHPQSKMPSYVI
jgi:hypothetical protein